MTPAASVAARWALPTLAALLVGPLVAWSVAGLRSVSGGAETSLLVGESPISGVFAMVLIAISVILFAAAGGRVLGAKGALNAAGIVAAWAAVRTGDMDRVYAEAGGGAIWSLLIEALLLAGIGVIALVAASPAPAKLITEMRSLMKSQDALVEAGATGAGALLASYVIAFDALAGQGLMAGVLGAAVGAAVGRLLTQRKGVDPTPLAVPAVGVLAAGIVAPLIGLVMPGIGNLDAAARAGEVTGPVAVQPLGWLAGAMLGVAIGREWAGSAADIAPVDMPGKGPSREAPTPAAGVAGSNPANGAA